MAFRPMHDRFVNVNDVQPAYAPPDQWFLSSGLLEAGNGPRRGAVPYYSDVAKDNSLYSLDPSQYPFRPAPDLDPGRSFQLAQQNAVFPHSTAEQLHFKTRR